MDIEKCTLEELQNLYNRIPTEINKRKNQQQEDDWLKVVRAIHNYLEKYGDIALYIYDQCFYLDRNTDFEDIGKIHNHSW